MGSFVLTILLAVTITIIGMALLGAYVIAPIIVWLISNPIAGLGLIVIFFVLLGALIYNILSE